MAPLSHSPGKHVRPAFTVIELVAVVIILFVLAALLLPATRVGHEAARRMQCSNNLKQLGLALHNYHAAYRCFPTAMGGTGSGPTAIDGNANRLSGLIALLPFLEQQKLWEQIAAPTVIDGVSYPAMGPAPWVAEYTPWKTQLAMLRCPSKPSDETGFGCTNYAFSIGDSARQIHDPADFRGAFACRMNTQLDDVTDGTSNTMAMAEIGTPSGSSVIGQFAVAQSPLMLDDPGRCLKTVKSNGKQVYAQGVRLGAPGRGGRWADGAAGFSLVNTILPPNSPSCAIEGIAAVDGIYSAGSAHTGGVQILMCDGSVQFISESIDCGDPHRPTLSPAAPKHTPSSFGVWGVLGTAAAGDKPELPE